MCWKEIQKFSTIDEDQKDLLEERKANFVERFFNDESEEQINISGKIKNQILSSPLEPNMFDGLKKDLFKLMKMNSYQNFLKSQEYEAMIKGNAM